MSPKNLKVSSLVQTRPNIVLVREAMNEMQWKTNEKKSKKQDTLLSVFIWSIRLSRVLSPATDEWRRFDLLIPTLISVTSWNRTICPLDCD